MGVTLRGVIEMRREGPGTGAKEALLEIGEREGHRDTLLYADRGEDFLQRGIHKMNRSKEIGETNPTEGKQKLTW